MILGQSQARQHKSHNNLDPNLSKLLMYRLIRFLHEYESHHQHFCFVLKPLIVII